MSEEELKKLYEKWDYPYKPSLRCFITTIKPMTMLIRTDSFIEQLEKVRGQAYYCRIQSIADAGFNKLACLIYYAMVTGIETPFDSLKSDKSFEWILNNLNYR